MASIIKIKRSATKGSIPSGLQVGEIAVNLFDRKLYVGNTAGGVSTIGGEDFRLTTKNAPGDRDGAYLKLLGESVYSTNNVLLQAGSNIDIFRNANGTITVALSNTINVPVSGIATSADKLETARTIELDGDVSGSVSFDGSQDVTITTTIADDSHNHIIDNVDGLAEDLATRATWVELLATNTAIRTLVDDRIQIANAQATFVNVSGDTMTGHLTLHANPTSDLHAATKSYVDEVAQGLQVKPSVEAATTTNLTASYSNGTDGVGATLTLPAQVVLSIDGWTYWQQYDGILVKNQTNAFQNGRYYISTVGNGSTQWVLTRCGYCDETSEIISSFYFVNHGTVNGGTGWVALVDDVETFTVGTDSINFQQFSGAGTYTAGTGLRLDGTVFHIKDSIAANTTGNAATATKLKTARTIALTGDVTGTVSFDGSQNVSINTSYNNDVVLGTDTSGNYVASITNGTYITGGDGGSESASLTLDVNATHLNQGTTVVARDASGNFSAGTITASLNGNATTSSKWYTARTLTLDGDIFGSATIDGSGNVTLTTQYNNDVVLGTDTAGDYVSTITGTTNQITVSGSGTETAAVTLALASHTIVDQLTVNNDSTLSGDVGIGGDLTVDGNLTVEGAVTYLSTSTVYTDDGMFKLAANNAGDTIDTGIYASIYHSSNSSYTYSGYFRDASDGIFKFYTNLDVEPTTTVNTLDSNYALAQIDAVIDGGTY